MALSQTLSKYTVLEKLGEGTYGEVFRATWNETGETVVLKRIRIDYHEDGVPATTIREISVLQDIHHTNVIALIDVLPSDGRITLVLEQMDRELRYFIHTMRSAMSPELLRSYSFQLLCGVAYLHSNRILHRDVKPENILINKKGLLKLTDFGTARYYSLPITPLTPTVTTLWYRAPEVLLATGKYDLSLDVWSAACVIAEMARGKPLFPGDCPIDQISKIFRVLGVPKDSDWPECQLMTHLRADLGAFEPIDFDWLFAGIDTALIDLLGKMLEMNPSVRITAIDALSHPYFDAVPTALIELCLVH
jgi:serine/threonine protein kinase